MQKADSKNLRTEKKIYIQTTATLISNKTQKPPTLSPILTPPI
jgi:hypothetical protein